MLGSKVGERQGMYVSGRQRDGETEAFVETDTESIGAGACKMWREGMMSKNSLLARWWRRNDKSLLRNYHLPHFLAVPQI